MEFANRLTIIAPITVSPLVKKSLEEEVPTAEKLRESILIGLTQNDSACAIAISYLKEDLKKIF